MQYKNHIFVFSKINMTIKFISRLVHCDIKGEPFDIPGWCMTQTFGQEFLRIIIGQNCSTRNRARLNLSEPHYLFQRGRFQRFI